MRECLFYWYSVFCLFWHGFSAYVGHLTQSVKKLYTGNEEFYCNIQKVYNGNGDEFRRPCPCLYRQNEYVMKYDHGFDKELVLVVSLSQKHAVQKGVWLRERLGALPEVEDVASVVDICRLIWCCAAAYPPYCGLPVLEGGNS